jgi:hypothetical protein
MKMTNPCSAAASAETKKHDAPKKHDEHAVLARRGGAASPGRNSPSWEGSDASGGSAPTMLRRRREGYSRASHTGQLEDAARASKQNFHRSSASLTRFGYLF